MRQSAVGIVVGPHVLNIYTYITTLNKRRGAYTCNTYYISALFVRLNLRIDTTYSVNLRVEQLLLVCAIGSEGSMVKVTVFESGWAWVALPGSL